MQTRMERAQHYRKKAEKHARLARSGQPDIAYTHRTIAERYASIAQNLERREDVTNMMMVLLGASRLEVQIQGYASGAAVGSRGMDCDY
jgi:hypothetical protein